MSRLGKNTRVQRKYRELGKIIFATVFACNLLTSALFVILYLNCYKTQFQSNQESQKNKLSYPTNTKGFNDTSNLFEYSADYAIDFSLYQNEQFSNISLLPSVPLPIPSSDVLLFCTWFKRKDKKNYYKEMIFKYLTNSAIFSIFFQNGCVVITSGEEELLNYAHDAIISKEWNHICIMIGFHFGKLEVYLNGKLENRTDLKTGQENSFSKLSGKFFIGSDNTSEVFYGELSQFLIFNKTLSNKELFWLNRFYYSNDGVLFKWRDLFRHFNYQKIRFRI